MMHFLLFLALLQEPNIDALPSEPKTNGAASELLAKPDTPKAPEGAAKTAEPPPVVRDVGPGSPAAKKDEAAPATNTSESTATSEKTDSKPWYVEMFNSGLMGYMIAGGLFMWPILFLGILALGVIIERYRSLKLLNTDTTALRRQVLELLQEDRVEEALQLCDSQQGPVPAILSQGLRKLLLLQRLNYDPGRFRNRSSSRWMTTVCISWPRSNVTCPSWPRSPVWAR